MTIVSWEFESPPLHFLSLALFAEIAQLVEHDLAKVGVAGPSPVFRSNSEIRMTSSPSGGIGRRARFRCVCSNACRFESCSGHYYSECNMLERWRNW